jgi:hypothetical protein
VLVQKEFQPTVYASSQCCMFRQPLSGLFGLKKKFVKRGRRQNKRTGLKCKFFSFFKLFFFFFCSGGRAELIVAKSKRLTDTQCNLRLSI